MKWLIISISLLIATPTVAENSSSWWRIWESTDDAVGITDALFSDSERRILRDFLRTQGLQGEGDSDRKRKHKGKKPKKQKALPPGLQKKVARGGQLPPGWQKKLARGEVLDGDLYESSSALPRGVLDRLPRGPKGTSIRRVDDRVARIVDATGVILDVLTGQ